MDLRDWIIKDFEIGSYLVRDRFSLDRIGQGRVITNLVKNLDEMPVEIHCSTLGISTAGSLLPVPSFFLGIFDKLTNEFRGSFAIYKLSRDNDSKVSALIYPSMEDYNSESISDLVTLFSAFLFSNSLEFANSQTVNIDRVYFPSTKLLSNSKTTRVKDIIDKIKLKSNKEKTKIKEEKIPNTDVDFVFIEKV